MTVKQSDVAKTDWNRITPGRLLVVLLGVVVGLFLSEHWFPKGWAVLIATASVVATTLYLLARLALAFLFHRPFQYSIRSMLIFTAIIAIAGGWMGQRVREAAKQKQALGTLGHGISKVQDGLFSKNWFGKDFFLDLSDVSECDYYESNATDTDLEYLKRFKTLKTLSIRGNPAITDAGLERLKDLKQLTYLLLADANITDAGLRHLEALENLVELNLSNTRVTGAGLKHLLGLKKLRSLWFQGAPISDEGLRQIQDLSQLETLGLWDARVTDARLGFLNEMKNLRILDLSKNPITDSGLACLKELKQLKGLGLKGTAITDAGLAQLGAFGELETLNLNDTGITDVGIPNLKKLKQLKRLNLFGTKMTRIGLVNLTKALPDVEVGWN